MAARPVRAGPRKDAVVAEETNRRNKTVKIQHKEIRQKEIQKEKEGWDKGGVAPALPAGDRLGRVSPHADSVSTVVLAVCDDCTVVVLFERK